jgi:DNA-binding NtrC family response regulator
MTRASRVMIVEDEPNVRLVLRTALISNDYLLSTAEDGETALRYLRQEPADLVLLDLRMPGLDGLALLRRLRAEGNGVPVVILTAHGSVDEAATASKLGAVDFLTKPMTPDALRKVVAEVLGRHAPPRIARLPEPAGVHHRPRGARRGMDRLARLFGLDAGRSQP